MSVGKSASLVDEVPGEAKPYVNAMLKASGLSEFDAITSVLFAISTHLDLPQYPILIYLGARGSGKTAAMRQLTPLCRGSTWIRGRTYATQRDELDKARTAFLDEADIVDNNSQLTDLYTGRYLRDTGEIEVNVKVNYGLLEKRKLNIFGATVMAKRLPIADVALRSRAITIHTNYRLETYRYTETGDVSRIAVPLADQVTRELKQIGEIDRVYQTWSALLAISNQLRMNQWRGAANNLIAEEATALAGGQGYEPVDAIIQGLDILSRDEVNHRRIDQSIRISEVVKILKDEFALPLKHSQIADAAAAKGFEISKLHGYPVIKVKKDLLDRLLPEKG